MFSLISLWLTVPWVAWPQWDACFPQVAVSDAPPRSRGRTPVGWAWTNTHMSYSHTSGSLAHFQGILHKGWWNDRSIPGLKKRTAEQQADNRLGSPFGPRQRAGLSELHVCLPLSPSGGFRRVAQALPGCLHIIKAPRLLSGPSFKEQGFGRSEVKDKTVSDEAWERNQLCSRESTRQWGRRLGSV